MMTIMAVVRLRNIQYALTSTIFHFHERAKDGLQTLADERSSAAAQRRDVNTTKAGESSRHRHQRRQQNSSRCAATPLR